MTQLFYGATFRISLNPWAFTACCVCVFSTVASLTFPTIALTISENDSQENRAIVTAIVTTTVPLVALNAILCALNLTKELIYPRWYSKVGFTDWRFLPSLPASRKIAHKTHPFRWRLFACILAGINIVLQSMTFAFATKRTAIITAGLIITATLSAATPGFIYLSWKCFQRPDKYQPSEIVDTGVPTNQAASRIESSKNTSYMGGGPLAQAYRCHEQERLSTQKANHIASPFTPHPILEIIPNNLSVEFQANPDVPRADIKSNSMFLFQVYDAKLFDIVVLFYLLMLPVMLFLQIRDRTEGMAPQFANFTGWCILHFSYYYLPALYLAGAAIAFALSTDLTRQICYGISLATMMQAAQCLVQLYFIIGWLVELAGITIAPLGDQTSSEGLAKMELVFPTPSIILRITLQIIYSSKNIVSGRVLLFKSWEMKKL